MELGFEWHEEKAKENLRKHGISFEEAKTVLSFSYPERQLNIRIISCRQATKAERKVYEQR